MKRVVTVLKIIVQGDVNCQVMLINVNSYEKIVNKIMSYLNLTQVLLQ